MKTLWRPAGPSRPRGPVLTFTPLAWLKLNYYCHAGNTEVGGYGVAGDPVKPLHITDVVLPRQSCTLATVDLDMDDLGLRWEDLALGGLQPFQYSSVWVHTHPGGCPRPSLTDEATFAERTGPWAVMFILAQGGDTSCRLKVNAGPFPQELEIPVRVDWSDTPLLARGHDLSALLARWEADFVTDVKEDQDYFKLGLGTWRGNAYYPEGGQYGYHGGPGGAVDLSLKGPGHETTTREGRRGKGEKRRGKKDFCSSSPSQKIPEGTDPDLSLVEIDFLTREEREGALKAGIPEEYLDDPDYWEYLESLEYRDDDEGSDDVRDVL